MKAEDREIRRKRRILDHAIESGNVAKTCRYFGVLLLFQRLVKYQMKRCR